jgi:hypothetical protein
VGRGSSDKIYFPYKISESTSATFFHLPDVPDVHHGPSSSTSLNYENKLTITPPLSIWARPCLTRMVPTVGWLPFPFPSVILICFLVWTRFKFVMADIENASRGICKMQKLGGCDVFSWNLWNRYRPCTAILVAHSWECASASVTRRIR